MVVSFMRWVALCVLSSLSTWGQARPSEQEISRKVELLLSRMTLQEKIGQMTQPNKLSMDQHPEHVEIYGIGSILSGGGEAPSPNQPESWASMVRSYQKRALSSRLKIPMFYAIDAVHGHNNVEGAVIFPHNIGLGATRNPDLLKKIAEVTAREVAATGIHWNFAPAVSVPQNIRWGRTYEGYSENPEVVRELATAYLRGLQTPLSGEWYPTVMGTVKHFVGDGGTTWGSSHNKDYMIDQGDTPVDEATLRRIHLRPYFDAIEAGAQTVMVSYSSWQGLHMHAHRRLIQDVLKGEMGFDGLVVSDWLGVFMQPGPFIEQVRKSIHAGIDIVMAVDKYEEFMEALTTLVSRGDISMSRIDDAVRRILTVKYRMGLFETPYRVFPDDRFGSQEHKDIARQAVRESVVLLQNKQSVLPLVGKRRSILMTGRGAHNLGLQSGGWTIKWQGQSGNAMEGTSLYEAFQQQLPEGWSLTHRPDLKSALPAADYGIVVIAEDPYAEGRGDRYDLRLNHAQKEMIARTAEVSQKTILVVLSGRPLVITDVLDQVDAVVAAFLPGSEGSGIADVFYGKHGFTGRLSYAWPSTMSHYQGAPIPEGRTLFPFGHGLVTQPLKKSKI
ncbi:MAG: glycoside hydrolase family 3 protein [Oligoflexales bacterium]